MKKIKIHAIVSVVIIACFTAFMIWACFSDKPENLDPICYLFISVFGIASIASACLYLLAFKDILKLPLVKKYLFLCFILYACSLVILLITVSMEREGYETYGDVLQYSWPAIVIVPLVVNLIFTNKATKYLNNNIDQIVEEHNNELVLKLEKENVMKKEKHLRQYTLNGVKANEEANRAYINERLPKKPQKPTEFTYGTEPSTSAFYLVKESFVTGFKYAFSSFRSYVKLAFMFLINILSIIVPFLSPFIMVGTYQFYDDLYNNREVNVLDSFQGSSGWKKYVRLYFISAILTICLLGIILVVAICVLPVVCLGFIAQELFTIILVAVGLLLSVILVYLSFAVLPINLVYSRSDLSAINVVKKSLEVSNGRKLKTFVSMLFVYLFTLVLLVPALLFVGIALSAEVMWLFIIPVGYVLALLPVLNYVLKLVEFKIVYQASGKEDK